MTDIFTDPKRDLPKTRKAEVDKENDFQFKQHDPYGFWKIHREKGQVPEALSGYYTRIELAKAALKQYLQ